ncbi:MAG: hypothetical protein GX682_03965 [Clostridiaceae bacterium]|nr:hypothetical protein [Clostridiaceae bacterium]
MEERSLRVYTDKTFFTKITSTITKMLIPTRIGINSMLISIKRNNVLKAYEICKNEVQEDISKKEIAQKKYEDTFSLYLESIDKHIMDSIYKKVKNDTASIFEKNALSKYYEVIKIKESEYLEYKYRKQKYLLELDYETIKEMDKSKVLEKYKPFYVEKMDSLYKGLLKHFSIKLADTLTSQNKEEIYEKIFQALEEYITTILPLKMENEESEIYKQIIDEYNKFENYTVGKLDQNEGIEKRMVLLSISRKLFTHSLPLIVAEQCYIKLLKDVRSLIVDTRVIKKQEKAYSLLNHLIEDYNVKLLSTKIYWDKPAKRDEYKAFWKKYQEIQKLKIKDYIEYTRQKEILFISGDLKEIYKNQNKYYKVIKFYKNKLVLLGAMKELKNAYKSIGTYVGRKALCRK